jgi:RHS repeat-associated protein
MPNSGVDSQAVVLPTGGGALRGLGETFEPDLQTGEGRARVPIACPPGRNGLGPDLALQYNAKSGNGPFGVGWTLDMGLIARSTRRGIPLYDESDTFVLSGVDLVAVTSRKVGEPGRPVVREVQYRPRIESAFAKITHRVSSEIDEWKVTGRDGISTMFGSVQDARVADQDGVGRVFAWLPSSRRDRFGNQITYRYTRDRGFRPDGHRLDESEDAERGHHYNQTYLTQIAYMEYATAASQQYLYTIDFDYGEPGSQPGKGWAYRTEDPFSSFRAGFEVRTVRLCRGISVCMHQGVGEQTVRTYRLDYSPAQPNRASLLTQVTVFGGPPNDPLESLPPLKFTYTEFRPERQRLLDVACPEGLPFASLSNSGVELADVEECGLPGLLRLDYGSSDDVKGDGDEATWQPVFYPNRGGGVLDAHRHHSAPEGMTLGSQTSRLADVIGTGVAHLVAVNGPASRFFPSQPHGFGDGRKFVRPPEFDPADPDVQLMDVDGDGVIDAIRITEDLVEVHVNSVDHGWERQTPDSGPRPTGRLGDPTGRLRLADVSGDGPLDLVELADGAVCYWPHLGRGRFGDQIRLANSPQLGASFDPQRMVFADVDGDGYADLIYVGYGEITIWLNQSGNRFSPPVTVSGTPTELDIDAVRSVDFLGVGTVGLLWSVSHPGAAASFAFLDLTGGEKPYLMRGMDNNCGALTHIDYATSTLFYKADAQDGLPWRTSLPFPVQVVTRIMVDDVFSGSRRTSEYRYHHGCWDGVEREFKGFGRVDQLDSCTFDTYTEDRPVGSEEVPEGHFSPPTETRTWFYLGAVSSGDGTWTDLDLNQEHWAGDPQLLAARLTNDDLRVTAPSGSPARRDAVRALHGRVSRVELYAHDDTSLKDRPYEVIEHQYEVIPILDERTTKEWQRIPVVSTREIGQRSTVWERGEDPMSSIVFSDDFDDFGQPRRTSNVALPRRSQFCRPIVGEVVGEISPDETNETKVLAFHVYTQYATAPRDIHLQNRVAEVRTYELASPPKVTEQNPADIQTILANQVDTALAVHTQFMNEQEIQLIGHVMNYYDGQAFTGLPIGQTGPFGALTRTSKLVITERALDTAYTMDGDQRRPRYLGGLSSLPAGAPSGFGDDLGYHLVATPIGIGYYADTLCRQYDFHQTNLHKAQGLVTAIRDARGTQTNIEPDSYWLLPRQIVDPAGLTTFADYDYRTQQPICRTDANGSESHLTYTGLGLPAAGWVTSRKEGGQVEGGSAENPDITFAYDFLAYIRTRDTAHRQPISVRTTQRVWHASNPVSDETVSTWEYTDGFGRLLQKRAQAADLAFGTTGDDVGLPAPSGTPPVSASGQRQAGRVVVSGWQVYDNKGRVVQAYEPFLDLNESYRGPGDEPQGHRIDTYYDPRGKVIRMLYPDGTQSRIIFGIPKDPENLILAEGDLTGFPTGFSTSPWETYTYDANDLAGLITDPATATLLDADVPADHRFTPTHNVRDALGRIRCQVARNGPRPAEGWLITRSYYDIRGNLLTVKDPLGRTVLSHSYDLLNRRLATNSIDGGTNTTILDAAGNPVEDRTSAGTVALRRYDALNRLVELWARDGHDQQVTLREHLSYGDQGTAQQNPAERRVNRDRYRLGRIVTHHDEAGTVEYNSYDFKGNVLRKIRQVISDAALEMGWMAHWADPGAHTALDPTEHTTDSEYDALNRPVRIIHPNTGNANTGNGRVVEERSYDRTGAIERVSLDDAPRVTQMAYNARGQLVLICYGNAIVTRYAYDSRNFRLLRQRSERCTTVGDTWTGHGDALQDFTYRYDPVGNVTRIKERVKGCGIHGNILGNPHPGSEADATLPKLLLAGDALVRTFSYDPLYRLTAATGRAHAAQEAPRSLNDVTRCGYLPPGPAAPTPQNVAHLAIRYQEQYHYDPAGNLLCLEYSASDNQQHWARRYSYGMSGQQQGQTPYNNQLTALASGSITSTYSYDANGNLITQNNDRRQAWDHSNRLVSYIVQAGQTATLHVRYLYSSDGTRIKKWVRKNGGIASTIYLGDTVELHDWIDQGVSQHNGTIHLFSKASRLASIRHGPARGDDASPDLLYYLVDHLGSSHIALDDAGAFLSREEYFPHGETSLGSYARKRYRYIGAERDEETGFYYMTARYYAPWLARWTSNDPVSLGDGVNPYAYCRNNPITRSDPIGKQSLDLSERHMGPDGVLASPPGIDNFQSGPPGADTSLTGQSNGADKSSRPLDTTGGQTDQRGHTADENSPSPDTSTGQKGQRDRTADGSGRPPDEKSRAQGKQSPSTESKENAADRRLREIREDSKQKSDARMLKAVREPGSREAWLKEQKTKIDGFYSDYRKDVDRNPLDWVLGSGIGWALGNALHGGTISDHPVESTEAWREVVGEIAKEIATSLIAEGMGREVAPIDQRGILKGIVELGIEWGVPIMEHFESR